MTTEKEYNEMYNKFVTGEITPIEFHEFCIKILTEFLEKTY